MRTLLEVRCVGPLAQPWRYDPMPLCRHRIEARLPKRCACGRKEEARAQEEARVS